MVRTCFLREGGGDSSCSGDQEYSCDATRNIQTQHAARTILAPLSLSLSAS